MAVPRNTVGRRAIAAVDVLRGRQPKFDYGLLLVMPFLAAAGGVLIATAIVDAVERRRAPAEDAGAASAAAPPVGAPA